MTLIAKYTAYMLIAASALLMACKKDEPQRKGEEKDKAKIIYINTTSNASPIPVYNQRQYGIWPFYNGVQFNNFPIQAPWSNGYKAFVPGNMTMRFDTSLSQAFNPPGPAAKIGEFTFPTLADQYYSVYSVGTVGRIQNIETVLLTDDLSLPSVGKAKVRIMNFSPDAGPVDIAVTGVGGAVLATNLSFKGVQDFFEINSGVYSLTARVAGTATIVFSRSNIIIDKASCYSIMLSGLRFDPVPPPNPMPISGPRVAWPSIIRMDYHANRWTNPLTIPL